MGKSATVEHSGNTVTVIAPSAEEAIALVSDAAPGYRTTTIDTVRQGGVAGFFATEMVRVVAEARSPGVELASADALLATLCASDGPFAGRLAAALAADADPPVAHGPVSVTATEPTSATATTPADTTSATVTVTAMTPATVTGAGPATAGDTGSLPGADGVAVHDTDDDADEAAAGGDAGDRPDAVGGLPAPCAGDDVPAAGADEVDADAGADEVLPDRDGAVAESPSDTGGVRGLVPPAAGPWCAPALLALGLPEGLVTEVTRSAPDDEVTWSVGLMLAVRRLCAAELPHRGAPIGADALAPAAGGDGTPVHLVVGAGWRHLAAVRPAIVSAATPGDLIDALRAAWSWNAPLGWVCRGDRHQRIDPFLIAAAVRRLIGGERIDGHAGAVDDLEP